MRVVSISSPGGPEVLTVAERQDPVAEPLEVVIEVAAAGVNRADVAQREGHYPPPAGASDLPGLEVSGTVIRVGSDVTSTRVGDRVVALLSGGGYAEQVAVDEGLVLPLPRGIDLVHGAGLPEAVATAWSNLVLAAGLTSGQTLLVHGGTSGVGHIAIQLAVALGATVYATAGDSDKTALCEQLGAESAIDYRKQDFVAEIRRLTAGRGVDVILDLVGGDYVQRDLDAVAVEGTVMVIATAGGRESTIDTGMLLGKRARIWGTTLRARPLEGRRAIITAMRDDAWPLIENGRVSLIVDSTYPLADAADAHRRMESGAHAGKIILTV